jgi:hypothetical protein
MGTCLWSALAFALAIVGGPQRSPLRFDEFHHEYIGQAACIVGAATHSKLILGFGWVVAVDDATQHVYQRMNNNLAIRSPLNIGYRFTLGRVPLFEKLGHFFDTVLK